MTTKAFVKSGLRRLGYEVRRSHKRYDLHVNAHYDQQQLLSGCDNGIIFDLGAHIGQTVADYRERFPLATIHAFEPFQESFEILAHTYRHVPGVNPHRLAVTDTTGEKHFFIYKSSATNSLLPVAPELGKHVKTTLIESLGTLAVPTTTLDDFCAMQNITHINILKMDIQGGELMALRGAAGLLQARSIDLIYTEVLFSQLYVGQAGFCDLRAALGQYDYILFGLYNMNYGQDSVLAWGDAIFVSPAVESSWSQNALS